MLTRGNIAHRLLNSFPALQKNMMYDADDLLYPYMILGDWASEFVGAYLSSELEENDVKAFFDFANKMAQSTDGDVENMLIVTVLETLAGEEKTEALGKKYLNPKGISLLKRVIAGWPQEWDDKY